MKTLKRTQFDKNELIDCGDYSEMVLYDKANKERARTKISKHRKELVGKYKWHLASHGYVVSLPYRGSSKYLRLHRVILGERPGLVIDHINMDRLDNRDENLRFATVAQNGRNKPVRGVSWVKGKSKWRAKIMVNQKTIYLGYFNSEGEAKKARRQAELKYFDEFAYKYFEEQVLPTKLAA